MVTPFERVKAAWDSPDRKGELNRVIELMATEGVARDALDDALRKLLDEIRSAGADDETEETINNVGDRLHGWCHTSRAIKTAPATPHSGNRSLSTPTTFIPPVSPPSS